MLVAWLCAGTMGEVTLDLGAGGDDALIFESLGGSSAPNMPSVGGVGSLSSFELNDSFLEPYER